MKNNKELWVKVQDGKIIKGPTSLPKCTATVSGYHLFANSKEGRTRLLNDGWIPCNEIIPDFNNETHRQEGWEIIPYKSGDIETIRIAKIVPIPSKTSEEILMGTDLQMIRVIEDILSILISKKVLKLIDLPKEVKDRIKQRQKARKTINDGK